MRSRQRATAVGQNNLPAQPTPLIGRERDARAVRAELAQRHVRLLTLLGPGGVGKTRLALAVGSQLAETFSSGAWLVDLSAVSDPMLVPSVIAQALHLRETADRPPTELLTRHLRERQLLLILDNLEQLGGAARFIGDLLASTTDLKILATSREPLRTRWESTVVVPPLEVPTRSMAPDELEKVPSIALFVQRARAVRGQLTLTSPIGTAVAEICARLDGLPLAIELAAAYTNVLSPAQILDRLRNRLPILRADPVDLPRRHHTMQTAIGSSYDLLPPPEQALFRSLGVFVGGFTLDSVEGAWREPPAGASPILERLRALVDKSLVQAGVGSDGAVRFRQLEPIREFALDQLEATGAARDWQARHAEAFTAFAERAERELRGPRQAEWLDQLESEQGNLRAALTWSGGAAGDPELELRLAGAMYLYWWRRGHLREGREWLAHALALDPGPHGRARARALNAAAVLAREQGDYRAANSHFEDSLAFYRASDDTWGIANALQNLSSVAMFESDFGRAARLLAESVDLWRTIGDSWGIAVSLGILGRLAQRQGDSERARALHELCINHFREVGDRWGIARFVSSLARVVGDLGDTARAAALHREGLAVFVELGEKRGIAECLEGLGRVASLTGRPAGAAYLWAAAGALRDEIGAPLPRTESDAHHTDIERSRETLGVAAFAAAWAEGIAGPLDVAVTRAIRMADESGGVGEGLRPARRPDVGHTLLSPRERQVLRLVVDGRSNRQIAGALVISESTAKFHVASILNKLGVDTRAQAAAAAVQRGLVAKSNHGASAPPS